MNRALTTTNAVDKWAAVINEGWQKSILGIIQTGRDLQSAHDDLGRNAFAKMVDEKLVFGTKTALKLRQIASHPAIIKSSAPGLLPNSWSVLSELTTLSEDDFNDALEQKLIGPQTGQSAARAIKEAYKKNGDNVVGDKRKKLPSPKEANKIAAATGRLVLASDDHVYSGATEAEVVEEKRRQRSSYGVRDAIEFLAQIPESPVEWKTKTMLNYSFQDFDSEMIRRAVIWLTGLQGAINDAE